ncbi:MULTISPECIES: DHA2 family efflux MFS transporter permease subunit [Virgibacillus]|uniref:DHA2 family efflux MFS transporter permease subunit n=1 Tax=Virgibacillus dokdonensis TaxID=302167 RepID=A0A2K9J644_9BACI|nr:MULTISPECIES: DHA2 family efflux MFS transporter permease subunit [Virgibacillus]AUJ25641.1 Multidrug export protein EmrB [Virgibacillus dokdonensis]NWO12147.1 DHA2 family efflux MFS transporter permease subunit [Virgibacillus sp.]
MVRQSVKEVENMNKLPIVIVLITGAFLAILNQTLLTTAIPPIMQDLHLTENTAQWVTTIFMLVNGIMIPITAFLIETFTTRQLFITAMGTFSVGTFICAISPSFFLLMTGRVIQAAGAGVMMPLMMTIFLFMFPIEKRGTAMGMVGLVIGFAPALGPSISGWLVEHFDWRSIFYVVLPLAIMNVIIAYFVMKNITKRTYPKVDILSILYSTLGFGGILYGFSSAGNNGWTDQLVLVSLAIGLITLALFITRQFTLKEPILEFRVFKNKIFTITMIIGMIGFIGLISAETILPIYMQNMAGFTPFESGLMILPGALLMGIMSPINGRIFDRFGARYLVMIGLFLLTITSLLYTNLSVDTSFTYLTIVFAVRMFGISMIMMPSTTAGLNQLSYRLIPHGSAMTNTMRQVAASIGTALLITIMTVTALGTGKEATVTGQIHGVNMAFYVATATSFLGLILAFFVKDKASKERVLKQQEA